MMKILNFLMMYIYIQFFFLIFLIQKVFFDAKEIEENKFKEILFALEKDNEHLIAKAICKKSNMRKIPKADFVDTL